VYNLPTLSSVFAQATDDTTGFTREMELVVFKRTVSRVFEHRFRVTYCLVERSCMSNAFGERIRACLRQLSGVWSVSLTK